MPNINKNKQNKYYYRKRRHYFWRKKQSKSIYNLKSAILRKTLMKFVITFAEKYDSYAGEFVSAMKLIDDEKYDMLTSKKAKFLFCHFKKIE